MGCNDSSLKCFPRSEESPISLGLSLMEIVYGVRITDCERIFRGFESGVSGFVPSYMSGLFQFRLTNPTNIA